VRQWKFQQLLDGAFVGLSQSSPVQFEQELKRRWAEAKFDVLEEAGTLDDFLEAESFELFVHPSLCLSEQLERQRREAYLLLRLNYQAKYFSSRKVRLATLDTWTSAIAKFSLLIAGVLAIAELLVLLFRGAESESQLSWIMGAAALSAALTSAGVRVFRGAKAISEETERYARKWVVTKILTERFLREKEPAKQLECLVESERVCVEELREFIRTFNRADYLF
jgi:hypothetical protein